MVFTNSGISIDSTALQEKASPTIVVTPLGKAKKNSTLAKAIVLPLDASYFFYWG